MSRPHYLSSVALVVVLGLAVRLWFRIGFVGGFPQDDGIYINLARLLASNADLMERYRQLQPAYLANPAESYAFRIAFVYPLSWCFRLFGEGDGPATLVGMASAALSISVVAAIARTAMGRRAGVGAALLLALLPHDVILTTRVLSDGPLRLFLALSCLFAVRGWRGGSAPNFALTGLMLGFAYLSKLTGAALFVLFGIALAMRCVKRRSPHSLLAYTVGFGAVLLAETAWYWWRTGQLFLHYRIVHSSILSKLKFEPFSAADFGRYVRVLWEGEFIWYAPLVLGLTAVGYYAFAGFGLQGWLWLAGFARAVRSPRLGARLLAGIAIGLYLFVECFPLDVRLSDGRLQYALVFRQWRFASLLTPAWVPLGGGVLARLWERSTAGAVLLLAACVMSGWPGFARNHQTLRGSQTDLRATAAFIQHRPERIYTDHLALSTLQYYIGAAAGADHLKDISALGESLPARGDLVITGGSRGVELLSEVWERNLPSWCRSTLGPPDAARPEWQLVFWIPGRRDLTRLHDLLILQYLGT